MHDTISSMALIQKRVSWRSYGAQDVEPEKLEKILQFIEHLAPPFWGNMPRFQILDLGPAGSGLVKGTYGMIKGAGTFLVGAVENGRRDMEDFGYLFEKIILFITGLDLATCWIGLTMDRGMLGKQIHIQENESIPCVSPLGYPANRRSVMDTVARFSIGAAKRKPWKKMFFNEQWGRPLEAEEAGDYAIVLEMLRLGPSSTNKQPWRIIKDKNAFHFFLQRAPGYSKMTSAADLQRIDMGISMCHFELAAKELSLPGQWIETKRLPFNSLPKGVEYLVSWRIH